MQCSRMTQRTPSSTIFPYTTLFRSVPRILAGAARVLRREDRHARSPARRAQYRDARRRDRVRRQDRKSTRLNSSHLGISYAVFCLQKKNKQKGEARAVEHHTTQSRT